MAASVASGHSQASRSRDGTLPGSLATGTTLELDDADTYEGTFEDTFEGTYEGTNSLTSSIEMRQDNSTLGGSVQSGQQSVHSRGGSARGQDLQSGLRSLDRGQAGPTAPAQGLCLVRVEDDGGGTVPAGTESGSEAASVDSEGPVG